MNATNIRVRIPAEILCCAILLAAMLAACGGGAGAGAPASANPAAAMLSGRVNGGQQPVSASQITAYTPGDGGFGSNAVALACVQTDASGSFSFGGPAAIGCGGALPTSFSCPSNACPAAASQVYLVAAGGNPGLAAGTYNTALVLMATLGPFITLSQSSFVDITELTTAASVYALAQTMGAANSGCVDCGGGLATRLQGAQDIGAKSPWLDHAVSRANSLVNFSNSAPGAALPAPRSCPGSSSDPVNCGAEEKLNSLADALAACVNTSDPGSSGCTQLFCVATPGASFSGGACMPPASGAIPTDTLQSALAIALNPGTVPAGGVFSLVAATPPFTPALTAAPNDWTLALNFSGGGLSQPQGIAIDAGGNVWVANSGDSNVIELNSSGTALSPSAGYTGGGLAFPVGIAIDAGGNIWLANNGGNSVTELSGSGAALSPAAGYTGGGLSAPFGIAIDAGGNVWVANNGNSSVSELNGSGTVLSPSAGYTGGGLNSPRSIAIDASGNIWVANRGPGGPSGDGGGGVSELSGSGAALSPSTSYTGGGLSQPYGIAVDNNGNVWATNDGTNLSPIGSVTELSGTGAAVSPSNGFVGYIAGLRFPRGIAIDGGGNVWMANFGNASNGNSVTELSSTGASVGGYTGGGLTTPVNIAIDADGNVWVTNYDGNSVTELIGAATPKKTPFIGPPQSP